MDNMIGAIDAQGKILNYLARLNDMLIMANGSGQNSLTKICEGLVMEIFSCIEDIPFSNANLNISNVPAIDLECSARKVALQVTSSKASVKVTDTIEMFLKKRYDLKYDRLILVVLANKNYDKVSIKNSLVELNANYGTSFSFEPQKDIIDLKKLYNLISGGISSVKVLEVHEILRRYLDGFNAQTNLSPYYSRLIAEYFDPVMDEDTGMTLSGIYVEPAFLVHSKSGHPGEPGLKFNSDHDMELTEEVSIHKLLLSRFSGDQSYDKLFVSPESKVTIVLGYPGQGKTSMCKRLLYDLLSAEKHRNVFYVKLKGIVNTRSLIHNPFNMIYDELLLELGPGFTREMLMDSITVLDGLDELYMKDNLNSEDIETFVKGLIREADKFSNWDVLVTTRYGYINFDRLYKENYIALLLKPLDISRQLLWLDQYRLFHPDAWIDAEFLADVNITEHGRRHFLGEIINQPLLLYIIASLDHRVDVNSGRTEIYNMLFDQIIDRKYSGDGQIENLKTLTRDDLRFMLQEIAYLIFKSGKGFLGHEEVLAAESLEDIIHKIGDGHLSKSLKGVLISFYFKEVKDLKSDQSAGIEFFHKSLQEYLTAERITEMVFAELLNKDKKDSYIVRKGQQLLSFLNELAGSQEITTEIWAFIQDLIRDKDVELRRELAERLSLHIDYLFEKDFIGEVQLSDKHTFTKMLLTFSFYWRFLQTLASGADYIAGKPIGKKFFSFYASIAGKERYHEPAKLLSWQYFHDANIGNLTMIMEEMVNTTFEHCFFNDLNLFENKLSDVNITNSGISHLILDNHSGDIIFNQCTIYRLQVFSYSKSRAFFSNCNFQAESKISLKRKKQLEFWECTFSPDAFEGLKKHLGRIKFTSCTIVEDKVNRRNFKTTTRTIHIADN